MFCKKCGKEHLEEAKFCPNCGASLAGDFNEFKREIDIKFSGQPVQPIRNKSEAQLADRSVETDKETSANTKEDHSGFAKDITHHEQSKNMAEKPNASAKSNKKRIKIIILASLILLFTVGGFFWWWQGNEDLRVLNKNLPEGIKIEKKSGRQVAVNEKDGYEIKVPKNWGEFKDVDYSGNKEDEFSMGSKNTKDWVSVSIFEKDKNKDLETCIKERFQNQPMSFYSPVIYGKENIGNYEVIKTKDEDPILGDHFFYYFQKESQIYEIYTDYSEESIRDIILNGKF